MITPPTPQPGDKTGIVTPSGKIAEKVLDAAAGLFEEWGFRVVKGRNVYSGFDQFGGTDRERAGDLQRMLDDEDIRAIFCSRGGYGAVRIIDTIDFSRFQAHPKWIVGYSDITVLHSHIQENFGIETLHALMPAELAPGRESPPSAGSVGLLRQALSGNLPPCNLPGHPLSREGKAEGVLTGGNLSVLYSLTGSASETCTRGKILFLEDVGEYLYHIDRMMVALKRKGVLEGLRGLVVGGMTGMNDNEVPFGKSAEEIIAEAVSEYGFPVLFGFPAGHQTENHPLILGREVILDVGREAGSLTFKPAQNG